MIYRCPKCNSCNLITRYDFGCIDFRCPTCDAKTQFKKTKNKTVVVYQHKSYTRVSLFKKHEIEKEPEEESMFAMMMPSVYKPAIYVEDTF